MTRLDVVYICTYIDDVHLEWDPRKAAADLRKHGARFSDAYAVREDALAVTIEDPSPNEERFLTVGLDSLGRLLVVSYTYRDGRIRIIPVRPASPGERRHYGEGT